MNIAKINLSHNGNMVRQNNNINNNYFAQIPNFGLKMQQPLQKDTVSFKAGVQTNKEIGELSDLITHALSKRIREEYEPVHDKMVKLVQKRFGKLINNGLISFNQRIKEGFSLREKTTTINASTYSTIMQDMKDISGGCFILNDKKAFSKMVSIILKMIKNKEIDVIEAEHYTTDAGENSKSLTALDLGSYKKLANAVEEANKYRTTKKATRMDDSKSGYSGLHLTLRWKGKNGEPDKYTEWQIMTKAMQEFKEVENLYYKTKFGKRISDKYRPIIVPMLEPLVPIDERYATKKEIKEYKQLRKDIDEYTLDAYRERNNDPFNSRKVFLHPSKQSLARFDFNAIFYIKDGIDKNKII